MNNKVAAHRSLYTALHCASYPSIICIADRHAGSVGGLEGREEGRSIRGYLCRFNMARTKESGMYVCTYIYTYIHRADAAERGKVKENVTTARRTGETGSEESGGK